MIGRTTHCVKLGLLSSYDYMQFFLFRNNSKA